MDEFQTTANRFVKIHFGNRASNLVPVTVAGEWSKAYFFMLDGHDMVIRFSDYCDDFEKDRVMGTYSSDAFPIPNVVEVGATESKFYAVSERVPGNPLDELSGPDIERVLPQLLEILYHLQGLDLRDTQGVGLWRPDGVGPNWETFLLSVANPRDRLAGWRANLDAEPKHARVFDAGIERLRELAPWLPEYRGIAHNDLLNRNVLVDAGKITGIIDWGNSFFGDPLYDIALFKYWWSWYPQWQSVDLHQILHRHWNAHGGVPPQLEERLHCCLIHIGLDHIAYSAFKGRVDDMRRHAEQVLTYIE